MIKTKNQTPVRSGGATLAVEIFGWYGALAVLVAYSLSSLGILAVQDILYQLLNLTGAIGLLAVSVVKRVGQAVLINVFWGLMATIALVRIILQI